MTSSEKGLVGHYDKGHDCRIKGTIIFLNVYGYYLFGSQEFSAIRPLIDMVLVLCDRDVHVG
jgi:hypothetical protein